MYEVMRYWDDDHPEWGADEHAFAAAWRGQPKWVFSRSLKSVGPNATLVDGDIEGGDDPRIEQATVHLSGPGRIAPSKNDERRPGRALGRADQPVGPGVEPGDESIDQRVDRAPGFASADF